MGRAPTNAETIALRRLFFDSSTLAENEFKQRSETAEPTGMPLAERNAKLEDQKKRMPGLHFGSEKEPIHKLVDTVCSDDACEDGPPVTEGFTILVGNFPIRRAVLGV